MQRNESNGGSPESAPDGEGSGRKRNWFARHKITAIVLSVLLVGLLAGGIFICSAINDPLRVLQNRTATSAPEATEEATAVPATAEDTALPGVTAADEVIPTEEPPPEFYSKDSVNFLILGTDMNAVRLKTATTCRTDCVMLASVNVKQKTAAIISMPRDTYLRIYDDKNKWVNTGRINRVFFEFGGGLKEKGPSYAINTVSQFLAKGKLPIDHYVVFNMDLVANLVDAVGGVDVTVRGLRSDTATVNDVTFYNNTLMHMDGYTAITYARDRHNTSGGDQGRVTHQQDVLIATLKALKDKGNIIKAIPELFTTYQNDIATDIQGLDEIIALAWVAKDMELSSIKQYRLTGSYFTPAGSSYVVADQIKKQEIVQEVFGIPNTADSTWTYSYLQGQIDKVREAGQVVVNSAKALLNDPGASAYPTEVKNLNNAIKKWQAAANNNDRSGMESALKDVKACYNALKAKIESSPAPTEDP
jgi:LCP family protein required for cell wall assembly